MGKKILVTGGAGFIGSNFIRHLLRKYSDYKIINVDKLTYCGNLNNLKDVETNPNYRFIKGDVCDQNVLMKLTRDCDAVVHFAAESHVDNSIHDPRVFVETNVLGTLSVLEAVRKNKLKRFIYTSTDEVYGSIIVGSSSETDNIEPNSPYSSSKASADLLVRAYIKTYDLPAIITRSSNNFGPYQYPEKLIPLFITNLLMNKKVPLYGDGLNIRNWIYVLDECDALDFLFHYGKVGEIYNVGGENEITNLELTKKILFALGKSDEFIQPVKDRPAHDRRYSLNSTKLKELGWKPKFNFDEAVTETVGWYKNNESWWRPLK